MATFIAKYYAILYAGIFGSNIIIVIEVQLGRKLRRSTNYFVEMKEQKHQIEIVSSKVVAVRSFFVRKSSANRLNMHQIYKNAENEMRVSYLPWILQPRHRLELEHLFVISMLIQKI